MGKKGGNTPLSGLGQGQLGFSSASNVPFLKKIKPLLPIIAVTCLGGILAFLFEYLPKPQDGQKQGVVQVAVDLARMVPSPVAMLKKAPSTVPVWLPLWPTKSPRPTITSTVPATKKIEEDARRIEPLLRNLANTRYFRLYHIDLEAQCPFWARDDLCYSGGCSVCHCEDDHIPWTWKENPEETFVDRTIGNGGPHASEWGDEGDFDEHGDALDFFSAGGPGSLWSNGNGNIFEKTPGEVKGEPTYVDLGLNRPKNTGYTRTPIWAYIYRENCIGDPSNPLAAEGPGAMSLAAKCTEEESFYKLISGFQSAITTLVANNFYQDPLPPDAPLMAKWFGSPVNLNIYRWGLAQHPDWTENMYFAGSVLMRTICKAARIMEECSCDTGVADEVTTTRAALQRLVDGAKELHTCQEPFLGEAIFMRKSSLALRQFRNITRIMDCVECESCRLHAKVKVQALHSAVKATSSPPVLTSMSRNELIALINGANYFAECINAVTRFRSIVFRLRVAWGCVGLAVLMAAFWIGKWAVALFVTSCCRKRPPAAARAAASAFAERAAAEALRSDDDENDGRSPNTNSSRGGSWHRKKKN